MSMSVEANEPVFRGGRFLSVVTPKFRRLNDKTHGRLYLCDHQIFTFKLRTDSMVGAASCYLQMLDKFLFLFLLKRAAKYFNISRTCVFFDSWLVLVSSFHSSRIIMLLSIYFLSHFHTSNFVNNLIIIAKLYTPSVDRASVFKYSFLSIYLAHNCRSLNYHFSSLQKHRIGEKDGMRGYYQAYNYLHEWIIAMHNLKHYRSFFIVRLDKLYKINKACKLLKVIADTVWIFFI